MRIKLLKLHSQPEIFTPIVFNDGVNLILGEKVEEANVKKGKKTNGVGKSLSIEFINFCLLKSTSRSRVSKIPLDKFQEDTNIILELEINNIPLTITRSKARPENPVMNVDGQNIGFSNLEDANKYLADLLFPKDMTVNISFREFMAPFLREEESEFMDIISTYDLTKRIPGKIEPHAFMFGINVEKIEKIKQLFSQIETNNKIKADLKKTLTEGGKRKISDVKSTLNSLTDDLDKINNALDSFKANEAYEVHQDELIKIQIELENLMTKRSALNYQLKRINSFPEMEVINDRDIEIIYNQFKSGLGDQISKSIQEVQGFKKKIDEFQRRLFQEKVQSIKEELDKIGTQIYTLEENKTKKLQVIDQKGVLKDIKNGYSIYYEKKDSHSKLVNTYDSYEEKENLIKKLKLEKDQMFLELDSLIFDISEVIKSFNKTILEIHEYVMDSNKASFDIKTLNSNTNKQVLSFEMRIDDDGSHSVDRTKVFIYDLALLFNEHTNQKHPKMLIHDNIFDVDQDTLIKSLNYLAKKQSTSFQYILTLNRDKIENEEKQDMLEFKTEDYVVAKFTKQNRFLHGENYSEL